MDEQQIEQDDQLVVSKMSRILSFLTSKTTGIVLVLLLITFAFGAGMQYGQGKAKATNASLSQTDDLTIRSFDVKNRSVPKSIADKADFAQFWEVWDLVSQSYFDKSKVDPQKMINGAIAGMVASLGDPYTTFLPPTQNKAVEDDLAGNFDGVGMELGFKDKQLVVMSPLDDTPAQRAGILAGDAILKIDGKETDGLTLPEAVDKIRGKKGTKVTLELYHFGDDKSSTVELTRDTIHIKSVTLTKKENNTIGYIKLSRFGNETNNEWDAAVAEVQKSNLKGLIVDVRNNPGGYLESAIYLASDFVEGTVVKQESSDGTKKTVTADHKGRLLTIPTVVIINKGSASAAEILSGALLANKRATLVGETSFGKGTVQEVKKFSNGAGIHITQARWLMPNDYWVHEKGIKPDVEVALTPDDIKANKDPQLDRALELIKK